MITILIVFIFMLIILSVKAFIKEIRLPKEERFCPEVPLIISLYFIFLELILIQML